MIQIEANNDGLVEFLEAIQDHGRTMLLPALLKTQKLYGYISEANARLINEKLLTPLADISGVIEFYSMLSDRPNDKIKVGICTSPVCVAKGAKNLSNEVKELEREFDIESVACLGLCDHAPAAMVGNSQIGNANLNKIIEHEPSPITEIYGNEKIITKNCIHKTSHSIETFLELEGFSALQKAISLSPKEVIEKIKSSGLRGRGGAGFPTGIKWESAAQAQDQQKYLVCNADESEPGTFKDQALIMGDPFRVLEGILIAAYAIGAQKGYCYIRGEYPAAQQVMESVIIQAKNEGYLGKNILGINFDFNLEIRSGAGAYICGEETALFESIEGKRGFPRIKPPFPTTHGLFKKPTAINNVETFANIPIIINFGIEAYRKMGSEISPGPRLFSVSGDVTKPGIIELTQPITLEEIIFNFAGGIPNQRTLQAVLLGGAAGKFIGPESTGLLLSEEAVRQEGLSLGSGAIMVFDTSRDMREIVASLGTFFSHESCGKCYPCQLGTQRQAEILDRNINGGLLSGDLTRLKDVGWTMTDASLCGLGQTAGSAVLSAIELWPDLFTEKEIN